MESDSGLNMIESRFLQMKVSPTLKAHAKQTNSTKQVYKFGFGQSPFPVPPTMRKRLQEYAHLKHYSPCVGEKLLKESISKWFMRNYKLDYTTESIIVSCGSKFLFYLFKMMFNGPIFLISPCWVTYKPQTEILKKTSYTIQTAKENNFFPTIEDLKTKLQNIKQNDPNFDENCPKLIVLNFPNNPTGLIPEKNNLKQLAEYFRKTN